MPTSQERFRSPSPRQAEALAVIAGFTRDHGFAPALSDIAAAMNVSISGAAALVDALRRKGLATSTPGIARSLRIVRPAG
jgi:SOS-response transcriptional repressor LexA